jgi:AcrR family transcriptional regulator
MATGFQRARTPRHKQQRRDELLAAARALALDRGVRAVSLTDIGDAAGLHKSAVLRYFQNREAVFLELAAEGWREWTPACVRSLAAGPVGEPRHVAEVIAGSLAERPLLCDLLAQAPLHLERVVGPQLVRDYKLVVLECAGELARAAAAALPPLGEDEARELVGSVSATAAIFWQLSHPPRALAELYAQDPRLAHAAIDFVPRLRRHVEAMALGLLTVAGARPPAR